MKKNENRPKEGEGTAGGQTAVTDAGAQETAVGDEADAPAPPSSGRDLQAAAVDPDLGADLLPDGQVAPPEEQADQQGAAAPARSGGAVPGAPGAAEDWGQPAAEGELDEDGAQPAAGDEDDDVTNRINVGSPRRAGGEDPFESTSVDPVELPDVAALGDRPAGQGAASDDETGDGIAEAGGGLADKEQAAAAEGEPSGDEDGGGDGDVAEPLPEVEGSRLESIIESLLFAADRPLVVNELKRLLGERDGKRITDALETLRARHADSGVQLVSVAGGWQLRTHPGNGAWVAKLVAGRPTRLSRAMMETLAIVAYRQPITRPEIDEIRGVDCGPVLRTLLDRALIRVIGKKEEVGRPILYGTTPEFLKIFSLRDLADLPTLREFHELGADDRAKVDATVSVDGGFGAEGLPPGTPDLASEVQRGALPDVDPEEEDSLMTALERATEAAGRATRSATEPEEPGDDAEAGGGGAASPAGDAADSPAAGRR